MVKNNVCLIIIDGWGMSDNTKGEEERFLHANLYRISLISHLDE